MMTMTSEKAPGYYTNTPNKPKGRAAKRMAFYALNRRKAQGCAVLKQLRAVMPPAASQEHQQKFSMPLFRDEFELMPFGPSYRPRLHTKVLQVTQTQEDFARLRKVYEQPDSKS